jgi:hypothetical protein
MLILDLGFSQISHYTSLKTVSNQKEMNCLSNGERNNVEEGNFEQKFPKDSSISIDGTKNDGVSSDHTTLSITPEALNFHTENKCRQEKDTKFEKRKNNSKISETPAVV